MFVRYLVEQSEAECDRNRGDIIPLEVLTDAVSPKADFDEVASSRVEPCIYPLGRTRYCIG